MPNDRVMVVAATPIGSHHVDARMMAGCGGETPVASQQRRIERFGQRT